MCFSNVKLFVRTNTKGSHFIGRMSRNLTRIFSFGILKSKPWRLFTRLVNCRQGLIWVSKESLIFCGKDSLSIFQNFLSISNLIERLVHISWVVVYKMKKINKLFGNNQYCWSTKCEVKNSFDNCEVGKLRKAPSQYSWDAQEVILRSRASVS